MIQFNHDVSISDIKCFSKNTNEKSYLQVVGTALTKLIVIFKTVLNCPLLDNNLVVESYFHVWFMACELEHGDTNNEYGAESAGDWLLVSCNHTLAVQSPLPMGSDCHCPTPGDCQYVLYVSTQMACDEQITKHMKKMVTIFKSSVNSDF